MKQKPFTWNYSQPEEYRFSLDSIEVPWVLSQQMGVEAKKLKVLDLCAGCGVMGFEFYFHYRNISQIDFVEVQSEYCEHFEANKTMILSDQRFGESTTEFRLLNINYEDLIANSDFFQKYDLILCNPPYFFVGQGKMSPSQFKNRCRFFIDSNLQKMSDAILWSLKKDGRAYVLSRVLTEHGKNFIEEWKTFCQNIAEVQELSKIRTATLLEIKHLVRI